MPGRQHLQPSMRQWLCLSPRPGHQCVELNNQIVGFGGYGAAFDHDLRGRSRAIRPSLRRERIPD